MTITEEELYRIVHIQAHVRGFLARRRLARILLNPERFLQAEFSSQYSQFASSAYENTVVAEKMNELIDFDWEDDFSIDLLKKAGKDVEDKEEICLQSRVKYTG